MPRIFISYRRDDSIAITGRIYDRLEDAFDSENVFQDVDDMPFGVDFRQHLQEQIAQCDVVLVIIGPQWVKIADNSGRRRLDNPADFVRIEVENGLKQNKLVIPVLVDGAAMPAESDLPESLRDLCYRNAATVRHNPDFRRDMARLVEQIERYFSENPPQEKLFSPPVITPVKSPPEINPSEPAFTPPDVSRILPPPFEWCYVPQGFVTLEDASDRGGTKGGKYEVPAFYIAKYPITNAQYQMFVDARIGYQAKIGYRNSAWWDYSDQAQYWRKQNPKPEKTAFPGADLPRTNVSWYESLAFCHWLNLQLPTPTAGEGMRITLPTEQQWQRAAQGDDDREFPWGDYFDLDYANTAESSNYQPTLVTEYPNGASPFGVFDLVGNVWEWCLTQWGEDNVSLAGDSSRVVRGGVFEAVEFYSRIDYRDFFSPDIGSRYGGFRIVCNPTS